MCMANALWARLDRVVYGATIADANRYCLQIHIPAKEVTRAFGYASVVEGPVLRDLCNTLFTHPNMQRAFRAWSTSKNEAAQGQSVARSDSSTWTRVISPALAAIVGDHARVLTQPQVVEQLSRDFYWYSPVLRKQLDGKVADLVVQPLSAGEIQEVLRYCHAHDLPVTARGAGTGNYGQAVPLHGGVVLDLAADGSHRGDSAGWRRRVRARRAAGRTGKRSPQGGLGVALLSLDDRQGVARADSSAEGPAASARWHMETCAISKRCARLKSSRWKPNRAWCGMRARRSTKFCTRGAPMASSRASGWRSRPRSIGRSASIAFDSFDAAFDFSERIATESRVDQAAGHDVRMADSVFLHSREGNMRRKAKRLSFS